MAIAFVSAATSGGGIGVTSSTISPSTTVGNTVIVVVATNSGVTVTGITSTPSQTWTFQKGLTEPGNFRSELWTSPLSSAAVTSIVVSYSGTVDAGAISLEYSGVQAFGVTASTNGNASTLTISLTTQDSNNFIVGGVTVDNNAITTTTGIQRATIAPFGGADNIAGSDNTVASPGSVSIAWSMVGSFVNVATTIELRSTTGAGTLAFDDAAVGPISIITSGNWVVS